MRVRTPSKCVYWAPTGATATGRPSLASPVELACRWDMNVDETIDGQGNTVYSSADVILITDVLVGGYLMLGTLLDVSASSFPTDPRQSKAVREILSKTRNPNLKGTGMIVVTAHLK